MGYIKNFQEFINESYQNFDIDFNALFDMLNNNYEVIGDASRIDRIDINDVAFIKIPVTTDGYIIEPDPETGNIIVSLKLRRYIDNEKYEIIQKFDEDTIFELGEGIADNLEFENGALEVGLIDGHFDESKILEFLDIMLSKVKKPALKKIS